MTERERTTNRCGMALEYQSDALPPEEAAAFERHLADCPDCRRELEELRLVWEALPADMERWDPPADLKDDVMSSIRAASVPAGRAAAAAHVPTAARRTGRRRAWALRAAGAAAAVALVACTVWAADLYRGGPAAPTEGTPAPASALAAAPARIERLVALHPSETAEPGVFRPGAYGYACVVDEGDRGKQFVVYIFGAPATGDDEVYQVWLRKGGGRTSPGTFRVDERGVGVLAVPLGAEPPAFDGIGITREPGLGGTAPRGTVLFTSKAES